MVCCSFSLDNEGRNLGGNLGLRKVVKCKKGLEKGWVEI